MFGINCKKKKKRALGWGRYDEKSQGKYNCKKSEFSDYGINGRPDGGLLGFEWLPEESSSSQNN